MDEITKQRQGKSNYYNEQFERLKDYSNIDDQTELLKYFKINCLHVSYSELAFPNGFVNSQTTFR